MQKFLSALKNAVKSAWYWLWNAASEWPHVAAVACFGAGFFLGKLL